VARAEFDGYSEDETVKVVMSGNQEPKSVDLTEEALAGGPEVGPVPC
jgi:DNA-binding protein YbaB